uniref:Response regulator n=1 Tax=Bermanella marisrubri TaxID=207949 RepID=UPI0001CEA38C|nr:Chain A, Response regulator [Bermanella marisrubri]3LTE_B Chain B, Response regulator [Bermanella marisrubri]3LTE_C Chain C, Response regulator [Bermanella marisrubri]3LTE_D Chain D, Response regulator [Bermanella marisrubri]3LTE_E Chain E, Response regulator [Bermanella marisrubri]3LTE_F Chain F, Response regulator [Bermanella marisrubri]3LTE_G Chain G, Response regulator [Bermanella marisrubri]3LTE_H Chain H, Response regulator [Bermanella marisrubri]3LTE_I Chain I, Response regulator 
MSLKQSKRILVVDDDQAMAAAIERVLKRDHWQVEIAHNGFDAGIKLSTFEPAIMTLDLSMPKLDGLDVIRSLRQNKVANQPKILVVSGLDKAKLQQAVTEGADDYLEKPFDNDALLDRIHDLVNEGHHHHHH